MPTEVVLTNEPNIQILDERFYLELLKNLIKIMDWDSDVRLS